jgi:outer membrane murein-binding lipoprotein Lpp
MKKKILLALVTLVLTLSIVLTGCAAGGVPQTSYDNIAAQLTDAQSKLTKAQSDLAALQSQKTAADADLQAAEADVTGLQQRAADLEKQVNDLNEQYGLTGATKVETAAKIIKFYTETHFYEVDVYDCNQMAADIWNMLKVQGINALLAVGNVDLPVGEITASNHAWVLAEVNPGEYLALETTSGGVVTLTDNPFYYQGWYFPTPKEFNEYLVAVEVFNTVNVEDSKVILAYNNSTNQVEQDKWMAVHNTLQGIKDEQRQILQTIPLVQTLE